MQGIKEQLTYQYNKLSIYAKWSIVFMIIGIVVSLLMGNPNPKTSFDRLQYTIQSELVALSDNLSQKKIGNQISNSLAQANRKWKNELEIQELYKAPYKLFIWKGADLLFWNNQKDLSFQNINEHKSDFLNAKKEIDQNPFRIEVLFPVIDNRTKLVTTHLLQKAETYYGFKHVKAPTNYRLNINNGEQDIYLKPIFSKKTKLVYIFIFLLYGLSLIFFLVHYSSIAIAKASFSKKLSTIAQYLLGLLAMKLAINYLIPDRFSSEFILFSSENSFAFYNSIADFLLTSIFIFIGIVSMNRILDKTMIPLKKSSRYWLVIFQWSIFVGFLLIISASRGLVLNTNMHFNVEEIYNIDKYSVLSITAVLLMLFSLFNYSNIFTRYVHRFGLSNYEKIIILCISLVLSLPIFYILNLNISIYITYGFFIILFLLLDLYSENNTLSVSWMIFWMIIFSGFTSVVFYNYSLEQEILQRKELVTQLYTVPANEDIAYISNLQKGIDEIDILPRIHDNMNSNIVLRQFDLIDYVSNKLKLRKGINIESFNKEGQSIFTRHFINEERFLSRFIKLDSLSPQISYDPFTSKYLLKYEVNDTLGNEYTTYISYAPNLKNFYQTVNSFNNNKTSLFIYNNNKTLLKSGNYEPNQSEFYNYTREYELGTIRSNMGKGQLGIHYKPIQDIHISSFKKIANIIKPISFFSYIFTLIGILIIIAIVINFKYNFLSVNVNFDYRHSLRLKIQFTLLIMIIISFVSVGLMTNFYFQNLIEKTQLENIKEKTEILVNNLDAIIRNATSSKEALHKINTQILNLAEIHNTTLLLFADDARILNTSQISQYSSILDYPIWFDFTNTKINEADPIIHRIISVSQMESFVPLYLEDKFIASVHIKHHNTSLLSNSILEFFSTLLNVYVFLFLLAGFIAIAVSNSITKPLKLLATKIVDIKLGKQNETIAWKGNDEIGLLIKNYNEMLTKIDNSAQLLAKTQRDQAWREMAKQVAHEIKNPLTPMKLSMQYLEKMVNTNPERATELIPRISKTLIEQIDNLTGIANAFSNFAMMPKATNQKVELNDVVETTHDLFRERDDMSIQLIEPIEDIFVFADKNHLVRILNNLLKNAMQAIPENRRGEIVIELYTKGEIAVIKVTDNGTGISDDMLDKVFTPNFTTKSSGTGLGLPIVANMIETFNGKIYFETELNVGTSFYVEIPKMRSKHTEDTGARVDL